MACKSHGIGESLLIALLDHVVEIKRNKIEIKIKLKRHKDYINIKISLENIYLNFNLMFSWPISARYW